MLKNCIGCTCDIFFISDIISDQDSLSLPHRRARNSSWMTALQAAVPVSKARLKFACTLIFVSDCTSVVMMRIIVFVLTIVMTMVTCVVMVVVVMVI